MKRMIGRFFIVAVSAIVITANVSRAWAGAYAYAGLTISRLIAFKEDSVADVADLRQGPNRDGTGSQLTREDFGPSGSDGLGGGTSALFETTSMILGFSDYRDQACVGDCFADENDFSRPPLQPNDPTSNLHFARADLRTTGSYTLSAGPTMNTRVVAEIELNREPGRRSSIGHTRIQRYTIFSVNFVDELVFDFDADIHLRSVNHADVSETVLASSSLLRITIADSYGDEIFRFAPDGTSAENLGARVIAAPFALNGTLSVGAASRLQDKQLVGAGQFRVITPTLTPGNAYQVRIEHEVLVAATVVPEPGGFVLMVLCSAALAIGRRHRRHCFNT